MLLMPLREGAASVTAGRKRTPNNHTHPIRTMEIVAHRGGKRCGAALWEKDRAAGAPVRRGESFYNLLLPREIG